MRQEQRNDRDELLVITQKPEKLLTVALAEKWYCLYLVDVYDFAVVKFDCWHDDAAALGVVPYVDHVPHPLAVEKFAKRVGYELDALAFELLVGRWELEAGGWSRGMGLV